jgi:hypothetical protein
MLQIPLPSGAGGKVLAGGALFFSLYGVELLVSYVL